ncbi:MAG: hypothetical protein LQ340_005897 [Diploschistes diacapsis]|nr:MAG: hypothetical protein LQ340_005897 [Diploschistes diacapsis]
MYAPQEQPNAEETREYRDASEWHNCAEQLRETSHLFESPPRLPSVQANQESQPMDDVEDLVMDDGEGERGSVAPSILPSSFYSDEVLPEGPLEEKVPFEETPLRAIIPAPVEATEKDERLQKHSEGCNDQRAVSKRYLPSLAFFSAVSSTE